MAVRRWMDENGASARPLIIWQNMRLGEMYPFFNDKLKEHMGIVEMTSNKLKALSYPGAVIDDRVAHARYILVKDTLSSSTPDELGLYPEEEADSSVRMFGASSIRSGAEALHGAVLMIDHSVGELSSAHRYLVSEELRSGRKTLKYVSADSLQKNTGLLGQDLLCITLNANPDTGESESKSWLDDLDQVLDRTSGEERIVAGKKCQLHDIFREVYGEAIVNEFFRLHVDEKGKPEDAFRALDAIVRSEPVLNRGVSTVGRQFQRVENVRRLRLCIPVSVLKSSCDITLVLKKKMQMLKVPFELVVTGVEKGDIAEIDQLKKTMDLPDQLTITYITNDEIKERSKAIKDLLRIEAPETQLKLESIKRISMEVRPLEKGECMDILTEEVSFEESMALRERLEDQLQDGVSIQILQGPHPGNGIFSLSNILNEWLKMVRDGNRSAIIILPALESPEEMLRKLGEAIRASWQTLTAA